MAGKKSLQSDAECVAAECLSKRVRTLHRVVGKIYNDALRAHGLTASQMNILVVVALRETARPAEICEALKMEVSTLSRNMDRMRANGWVLVDVDTEDRRARLFRLSPAGETVLQAAVPSWRQAQAQVTKLLGKSGSAMLEKAAERAQQQISG